LFKVQVTSVGRKAQQISKAPASVFVLTAADIRRSGATSIPEALRFVPGVTALSMDDRSWVVSIRGSARLYSDKILVMIDGRSLYTPLFSGVLWDTIDVSLSDVERIEVVRGPGAVMWGPNAVNGVINIITKKAEQTKGGQATVTAGTGIPGVVESRWGASANDRTAFRIWGKLGYRSPAYGSRADYYMDTFTHSEPSVSNMDIATGRLGFRIDGQPSEKDQWSVQGDLYKTDRQDPMAFPTVQPAVDRSQGHTDHSGGYLQAHWTRTSPNGSESVWQLSYDRNRIGYPHFGGTLQNINFDFQKRKPLGESHEIYWGAGFQQYKDTTESSRFVGFNPASSVFRDGDLVLRDEWQVVPGRLTASTGIRLDYNSYRDLEWQPSFRLLYTPKPSQSAWAAFSRAVRTPNRVDRDVIFDRGVNVDYGVPVVVINHGSRLMRSEVAKTLEGGFRFQSGQRWSVDTSVFRSAYGRLRAIESGVPEPLVTASGFFLQVPLKMTNSGAGRSYGGEAWATVQLRSGWRLIPSYSYVRDNRWLPAPSTSFTYIWDHVPTDLRHQGGLRSQHDLARNWQLDLMARARSRDNSFGLPGALLVDASLKWRPARSMEISCRLQNLTNRQVFETVSEGATPAIPTRRTLLVGWTQRF
jgi:iron complex outermembrane receptor protein